MPLAGDKKMSPCQVEDDLCNLSCHLNLGQSASCLHVLSMPIFACRVQSLSLRVPNEWLYVSFSMCCGVFVCIPASPRHLRSAKKGSFVFIRKPHFTPHYVRAGLLAVQSHCLSPLHCHDRSLASSLPAPSTSPKVFAGE